MCSFYPFLSKKVGLTWHWISYSRSSRLSPAEPDRAFGRTQPPSTSVLGLILPRTTAVPFVPVGTEAARSPRPSLYREDQASTARGKSTSTVGGHVGPSGAETVFAR